LALLEITDACNLACPACYAQSPAGKHHDPDVLINRLDAFLGVRGKLDVLQLSGGEPTIHPDFFHILDAVKERDVAHVMINTNGLRLAEDPDFAAELKKRAPGLELYLQLDGLDKESHRVLRGRDLLEKKRSALQRIAEHHLPTTLVVSAAAGVNEGELGELLRLGLAIPEIRGITLQPVTYSGRYDLKKSADDRLTVAHVVEALVAQTEGIFEGDDFKPLPCSDPNCCTFTYVTRLSTGKHVAATRLMDYDAWADRLADRIHFDPDNTGGCCGIDLPRENFFRVVIKPFMDAFTYDQHRVDECCVHVIGDDGEGISFCEFNTRRRGVPLVQIGSAGKKTEGKGPCVPGSGCC
jgi:uncharacterized radical SAM superfamily Fe-S cluster-containing enzyme